MSEIELPEIDTLDTPFKKRVAITAAFLVLVGGLLALGASLASEREQQLSLEAQAATIKASSGYGAAYSEIAAVAAGDADARSLRQRAELARVAATLTGSDAYLQEADALDVSVQGIADLAVPDEDESHFDDVNRENTNRLLEPREDALRADAKRETAAAWGTKADRYVLGITLLGVALALLGLSLTLPPRTRRIVVLPAVLIALFAAVVSGVAARQHPSKTPDEAVQAVAEGDRLMSRGRYDAAVEAYSEAIELRDDYAQAYRARGTAYDLAGSPETSSYVFTTVDKEFRDRSIADLGKALELSPVADYLTLVNQGANVFHVKRYAESEELTARAIKTNDRLPLPWSNLAMAQAAQGKEDEARASFEEMIERVVERPDPLEQFELFAAVRSALEILKQLEPSRAELVERFTGMMVAAQAEQLRPGDVTDTDDAEISNLELTATGLSLNAAYDQAGLATDSRITWVGYFRPADDEPWQQPSNMLLVDRLVDPAPGPYTLGLIDTSCPGPGDYRLDAWLDDRLLASAETTVAAEADRYVRVLRPAEPSDRLPSEGVGARRLGARPGPPLGARRRQDPAHRPRRAAACGARRSPGEAGCADCVGHRACVQRVRTDHRSARLRDRRPGRLLPQLQPSGRRVERALLGGPRPGRAAARLRRRVRRQHPELTGGHRRPDRQALLQRRPARLIHRHPARLGCPVAARLDVEAARTAVVRLLGVHLGRAVGTRQVEGHPPSMAR